MDWKQLYDSGIDIKNIMSDSEEYQAMSYAAFHGDSTAEYAMGLWYEEHNKPELAKKWYAKAAKKGFGKAVVGLKRVENSAMIVMDKNKQDGIVGAETAGVVWGNVTNANTVTAQEVFHARQGHGYAAEQAEHLMDVVSGKRAELVGSNLAKNGADRIVDGVAIQTKYCASGGRCVAECFENGKLRYLNADGTPMKIEVPSDKYEAAVKAMEERIKKGEVPGVTDPVEAKNIIKKGHFTYLQAKNIAKAGTVESIVFDSVNGAIVATTSFGISAVLAFATSVWNGESYDVALKTATHTGLKVGGTTFVSAVIVGQLSKTGLNSMMVGSSEAIIKMMGPKGYQLLANAFSKGGNIYGAAAIKNGAKLLRNNAITAAASFIVLSSVDIADIFRGRISGAQLFKNLTKTAASAGGGIAGWTAGAAAGAAIGSFIPVIGNVVGAGVGAVIGSVAGGSAANSAADKVLSNFIEDDAKELLKIIQTEFGVLAGEYLLTRSEAEEIVESLKGELNASKLKEMFASDNRKRFARRLLEPKIEAVITKRQYIELPSLEDMQGSLRSVLEEIAEECNENVIEEKNIVKDISNEDADENKINPMLVMGPAVLPVVTNMMIDHFDNDRKKKKQVVAKVKTHK